MIRTAIYSGSFDPPTNGHAWMIKTAAQLFDKLYIAVGINPGKHYMFTIDERIELIKGLCKESSDKIEVVSFKNQFLIDFASKIKADYIIRGIRSESDYQFERGMLDINRDIGDVNIDTIFLMPPKELQSISSSMVKGLIGYDGWIPNVKIFVPKNVSDAIIKKVG
jgi:pantetheine-phosphate adenylyltransferase